MNPSIHQSIAEDPPSPSPNSAAASAAYVYSAAEKVGLLLPCARQKWFPRQNLFVGPYAGEFGPELMQFQAYVRARRRYYKEVHVLTYPGREYLYEGCHVHAHDINLKDAGYWYGKLSPAQAAAMANAKAAELGLQDYDIFNTSLLCTQYHKRLFWPQEFRLLEERPLVSKPYDLAVHFRAIKKVGPGPMKNYSPESADELVQRCVRHGLSVACVGHPEFAYCPAECDDHRHEDMHHTVAAICSARLGVGGSSGAMHLMNACGKPTVVWGDATSVRWNPFRVPISVVTIATWQPLPKEVCRRVVAALDDLRARTEDFTRPAYTLPAQPIGYF